MRLAADFHFRRLVTGGKFGFKTGTMSKKNKSGNTAFGAAMPRLIEQYQPGKTRLFNDPVLQYLLPAPVHFFLRFSASRQWMTGMFDKQTAGIAGSLVCRTKYIDDKTRFAVKNGVKQLLILGSGLDTRPYRLPELKDLPVYELDLKYVQQFKTKKLKKHLGSLPPNIRYLPVDFNHSSLSETLKQSDFKFNEPVLIICEAVSQYITQDAAELLLSSFSGFAQGSYLLFTYILESVIQKRSAIPGVNDLLDFLEKRNSPWLSGFDPDRIAEDLGRHNIRLLEDQDAGFYQRRYLEPLGRTLPVSLIERSVFACIQV